MKNKNLAIVITASLVIASFSLLLYQRSRQSKTATPLPTQTIAPINPTQMPKSLSSSISSYTNVPALSFPATLPIYSLSKAKSLNEEASRIADLLQIDMPAQTVEGSKGKYIIFQNNASSLIVSESPFSFTYKAASLSGSLISYDPRGLVPQIMTQFTRLSISQPQITPGNELYTYFAPNGASPNVLATPLGATMVQIDVPLLLNKLPLYINDANTPALSARFDGDKNLIQIQGAILPNINKESKEVTIISYKTATSRLQSNEGILSSVWLSNDNGGFLTGATPKEIDVSGVSLGYLYIQGRDSLVPVFVFSGKGFIAEENRTANTTTIVSALP